MPSKMVTNRQKSSATVQAAAETHATEVAAAVSERLTPYLQRGETMPDLAGLITLSGRALAEDMRLMVQADEAHAEELRDDPPARHRRDTSTVEVKEVVVGIRDTVRGVFGPTMDRQILGLDDISSNDPVVLERQAATIVSRLQDPDLTLPPPILEGVSVDPGAWVTALAPPAAELRAALGEVATEIEEAESTLAAKLTAMASYDRTFTQVAAFLEGIFRLGGKDALASRVRPSLRRPGRTMEDAASEATVNLEEVAAPVATDG